MDIGLRPLSFPSTDRLQTLRQQVSRFHSEVEQGLGSTDEFSQGYPIVRQELYTPVIDALKDQHVQPLSTPSFRQSLLESGVAVSGNALLGLAGAVLHLTAKDGGLQALYSTGEGFEALDAHPGKLGVGKRDAYVVDLPTGRQLTVSSNNGPLTILSTDDSGELASTFKLHGDDIRLDMTSVGNSGLQAGVTYIPGEQGRGGEAKGEVQVFDLQRNHETDTLAGQVYAQFGPVGSQFDPRVSSHRFTADPERATFQPNQDEAVAASAAAARAAQQFLDPSR